MRKFSILVLALAVFAFSQDASALGGFCVVLGFGLFILSAGVTKDEAAQQPQKRRPARRNRSAAKKDYNHVEMDVSWAPAKDAYAFHGTQKEYFCRLLTVAFPQYTLERDVPVGKNCADVTFLLKKDDEPRLAIVLGGREDGKTEAFRNTQDRLERKGVAVQYYIDCFRNKASYVYSRVSDALN